MPAVSEIAAKVLSEPDEDGVVSVAVKARVAVESDEDEGDGYIEVQGVDAEGFEVACLSLFYKLAPGQSKVLTDRTTMSHGEYERIVEWQQKG